MRIHPFRGLRYADGLENRGRLAAPPYDQIDDAYAAELRQIPHQFAWLTRPLASERANPYHNARMTHEAWLRSGVLQEDGVASLYPCEIRLPGGGRRLGLTALVGLEDPTSGVIRPHEQTVARTVDERLALRRSTELDLEPILLLSDDDGGLDSMLAEDLAGAEPLAEHQDSFGNRHRIYSIQDADRIELYQRALGDCPGLIADGHHRYEVALRHAGEQGLELGTRTATKLAVITSLRAPALTIDPIHRGLQTAVNIGSAAALSDRRQPCQATSGATLAAAVAAAAQPAIGVLAVDHPAEIWSFSEAEAPTDLPTSSRHLAVGWLHGVLLPALGLQAAAGRDGRVVYRSDPERLFTSIRDGELAVGFFLPPMSPQEFSLATAHKALLPPKSTRFLPKLVSGQVWARLGEK